LGLCDFVSAELFAHAPLPAAHAMIIAERAAPV
jgi:hypothetical protein